MFISKDGNSTASGNQGVLTGLIQTVQTARRFVQGESDKPTPAVVKDSVPNLKWVKGGQWIQRNIIERKDETDHAKMGTELYQQICEEIPPLKQWPPIEFNEGHVSQGKLAAQYYEELRRVSRACNGNRRNTETELSQQFPLFSIWAAIDNSRASLTTRQDFFSNPSSANREKMFALIGGIMGASGATVYDWFKKYHAATGKGRKRRKHS
jgi:hypothetical protein